MATGTRTPSGGEFSFVVGIDSNTSRFVLSCTDTSQGGTLLCARIVQFGLSDP